MDEQFTSSFVPTIGIDFHVKSVELKDGRKVKLQVGGYAHTRLKCVCVRARAR